MSTVCKDTDAVLCMVLLSRVSLDVSGELFMQVMVSLYCSYACCVYVCCPLLELRRIKVLNIRVFLIIDLSLF